MSFQSFSNSSDEIAITWHERMTHWPCEASMFSAAMPGTWLVTMLAPEGAVNWTALISVPQYKNDSSRSPFWRWNAQKSETRFIRKQNYNWSARTKCNNDGFLWRHSPWNICREAAVSSEQRQSGNLALLLLHIRQKQKEAKHRHTGPPQGFVLSASDKEPLTSCQIQINLLHWCKCRTVGGSTICCTGHWGNFCCYSHCCCCCCCYLCWPSTRS